MTAARGKGLARGIGILVLFAVPLALTLPARQAAGWYVQDAALKAAALHANLRRAGGAAGLGDFQERGHGEKPASAEAANEPAGATETKQFTLMMTEHQGGQMSMTKVFANGANLRMEPMQSKTVRSQQGVYAVSHDGGHTIYSFNPATHEVTRADVDVLEAKVIEKLKTDSKERGLQIESPKVETVEEEPSDPIDGHPTQHYKVRITYTLHFLKSEVRQTYVEYHDLWMATDVERAGAPIVLFYFVPSGDPRIDTGWWEEIAQIPGIPLRQVTLRTEVIDGNSVVTRYSRDITGVQFETVPDSLFKLPTGYKEVEAKYEVRAIHSGTGDH